MEKEMVRKAAQDLWKSVPGNRLCADMKIKQEYIGILMYDSPIVGFASANDPLFEIYKKPEVIGPWHMSPKEWLPEAKTVISFFFPASREVRESNRNARDITSQLWAHARIEGQQFIDNYMSAVADWFQDHGAAVCVPSTDARWRKVVAGKGMDGYLEINETTFGSSWSERHAAYVCGLGTFGLSKGLITNNGMAGRFGSVLADAEFDADPRPYSGIYDYCIRCGACIRRCPAHAIDMEQGKDHTKCKSYISSLSAKYNLHFSCGLCQTGVPCEERNPMLLFHR